MAAGVQPLNKIQHVITSVLGYNNQWGNISCTVLWDVELLVWFPPRVPGPRVLPGPSDAWRLAAITSLSVLAAVLVFGGLLVGVLVHKCRTKRSTLRGEGYHIRKALSARNVAFPVMSVCGWRRVQDWDAQKKHNWRYTVSYCIHFLNMDTSKRSLLLMHN